MDWHSTQNQDYILLLKSRLNGPLLHWVDQFVKIISQSIGEGGTITINDLGCGVGNFFRGVDCLQGSINYRGYDVSDIYLSIAREFFPAGNFLKLDISEQMPQEADVTVMSATLEHIDNYTNALKNIFSSTKKLFILRTFVGPESLFDRCRTFQATDSYLIRQFTIEEIRSNLPEGWRYDLLEDSATNGKIKFVCNGLTIPRRQQIFVFSRSEDLS
jgi:2-polyprenyl-3-methyl-5-hydroxy-6-metoxy-1,4-benzoquinol methylase